MLKKRFRSELPSRSHVRNRLVSPPAARTSAAGVLLLQNAVHVMPPVNVCATTLPSEAKNWRGAHLSET